MKGCESTVTSKGELLRWKFPEGKRLDLRALQSNQQLQAETPSPLQLPLQHPVRHGKFLRVMKIMTASPTTKKLASFGGIL